MTALVGIDLHPRATDDLAAKVRRAGQARALTTFAKDVEDAAKKDLRAAIDIEAERTGTGFSAKVDGIRATLSDPQWKPSVTDVEAFQAWWVAAGLEFEEVDRLVVTDPALAVRSLTAYSNLRAENDPPADVLLLSCLTALAESLSVEHEVRLPAKPCEWLMESGRAVVTDAGLMDTSTGELIPGVEVRRSAPVLSVVPDKAAKARDAAVIRSYFGWTPAVTP